MTDVNATIREFATRLTHRLHDIKEAKDRAQKAREASDHDIAHFWEAQQEREVAVYRELRGLSSALQIHDKVMEAVRLPDGVEVF